MMCVCVCEQLARGRYVKRSARDSNLRPIGCKSDALTTTPPHHGTASRLGVVIIMIAVVYNHLLSSRPHRESIALAGKS